jgi:selenocysteine lyase/cysteine desulfurase
LKTAGAAAVVSAFRPEWFDRLEAVIQAAAGASPEALAKDEAFWSEVRRAYSMNEYVNLRGGWVGTAPRIVEDAVVGHYRRGNSQPTLTLRYKGSGDLELRREEVRKKLAAHLNSSADEIAITRNSTEAIHTALFGLDLRPGDEVLTTNQEHTPFLGALLQRQKREGIVARILPIPAVPPTPDALVDALEAALTPRTRAILICHVMIPGQILPVRRVCDMAHHRGVKVIVDGALAVGQVECDLKSLDCDYYGASFHKWMNGPHGTGFLFVKREHVRELWPMFGNPPGRDGQFVLQADNIRKFESYGNSPLYLTAALGEMIDFHEMITPSRRRARLHYLKRYWADRVRRLPGVRFYTSLDASDSCAIASFVLQNVPPARLEQYLAEKHRILVAAARWDAFPDQPPPGELPRVMWVTTSMYNTPLELDRFVEVVQDVARKGLPA